MYDNFDILITEDRVLITGSEQGVQAPGTADLVNEIRKLQGNLDMIAENQVDAQLLDEFGTRPLLMSSSEMTFRIASVRALHSPKGDAMAYVCVCRRRQTVFNRSPGSS